MPGNSRAKQDWKRCCLEAPPAFRELLDEACALAARQANAKEMFRGWCSFCSPSGEKQALKGPILLHGNGIFTKYCPSQVLCHSVSLY